MIRRARCDVALGGQLVREGECVFSILHAGNRDPEAFVEPDRLLFDRPARRGHLGFGTGPHACMGAAMARSVVGIAMNAFFRTWPQATLAPGHARVRNLSLRGFSTPPVRLVVQAAPAQSGGRAIGAASRRRRVAAGEALSELAENQPRRINAVAHASDARAVRDAVLAANRQGVPLYPVSTGKNWGVGSRSPVEDGCVLLELSGMNRIRTLDLDRGIAVIEPGVTQGALADRLASTPFLLNVTTSCRGTSVVGNVLDKGQGMLRLRDEDLLGLEVVLGNGDIATTGVLGPTGGSLIAERGAGPDATRLFCQSNFGVVTAAAIALVPRPERTAFAYATFAGAALPALVDRVARLRRDRVIGHIVYLGEMQVEPARRAWPDFSLLAPLLGRRTVVGAALDLLRAELAAVAGCKSLRAGEVEDLAPTDPLYHRGRTFLGIPSCEPLQQRFGLTSCDLDQSSARGWAVVQTSLPLDGGAAADALEVLGTGVDAWGLPVQPHFSSVGDRTLNLMTMIWFERDAQGIERMRGLRDELRTRLGERGFCPSREGIDAQRLRLSSAAHDVAWAQIKAAFDPNGVIAPGRYVWAAPVTAGAHAA
jgi:4-cresol dehydrogenase (hydroxylating) flavoprotein subunit